MANEEPKTVRFTQDDDVKPLIKVVVKRSTIEKANKFIADSLKTALTGKDGEGKPYGGKFVEGTLSIYAE